jgi:hypothetical protein
MPKGSSSVDLYECSIGFVQNKVAYKQGGAGEILKFK